MITIMIGVAIGGGVGSALRYALSRQSQPGSLPAGTLYANMAGSLILGVVLALTQENLASPWVWSVIGAGFAGGLSTFSTLALELADLYRTGKRSIAYGYGLVTLVGGLASAAVGYFLTSALTSQF